MNIIDSSLSIFMSVVCLMAIAVAVLCGAGIGLFIGALALVERFIDEQY